jgi:inosine-uridine nucleoside N-ribohydrolase
VRVWIDTDIGDDPDDEVALLCALAHPEVELVGVSTVDGDVDVRTERARELVTDVPVVAGCPPDALAGADALLLIGPWTHGAELATRGALPGRVAAMGGARRPVVHRGELRVVEHNVGRDPSAARALLETAPAVLVTPLDVTASIVCSRADERAIVAARPDLGTSIERWRGDEHDAPLCLHDPLALLALAGEPGIEIERAPLSVGSDGVMRSRGRAHDVVVAADRDTVVSRVLALLG